MTARSYTSPGWLAAYAIGAAAWVGLALVSRLASQLLLVAGAWRLLVAIGALTRGDR